MAKTKIKARITATVDVFVDNWSGGSCDMDALFEQVRKEGRHKLESLLKDSGTVVGDPTVRFVVVEEDR